MTQSLAVSKGYQVKVPFSFRDDHGRTHAPLTGAQVEVGDESIIQAQLRDDNAIEVEAREVGQTWIKVHVPVGGDDEQEMLAQLMVSVSPPRQEGELAQDGPSRVEFMLDRLEFQGQPRTADPERQRERERRREMRDKAQDEVEDTNDEARRQDRERMTGANEGKTPEQLALEARGPANPLEEGGPEQPNRLAAMGAGRSPSVAAGTTADRPQDNPDDPAKPHNPGNQGGGDTTGHMLSRPGDPKSVDEDKNGDDKKKDDKSTKDSDKDGAKDKDKNEDSDDDNKSRSAQQRGGAAQIGTTTSSPGSRRG
jgi:hypothetical protein